MRLAAPVALLIASLTLAACSTTSRRDLPPLETVPSVDLVRYSGRWYEIARFDHWFEDECVGSLALYALGGADEMWVINQCHVETLDGPEKLATGAVRVADEKTKAKLEVSFQWPLWEDYWIIDLDPDYRWAVVGHPSRDYLWILSRSPKLDDSTYEAILERLQQKQYDVSRLQRTVQP
jgi:apolipoprotein D and lipocalin family protein